MISCCIPVCACVCVMVIAIIRFLPGFVTGDEPSTDPEESQLPAHLTHRYRDPLLVNPEVRYHL